VNNTVNGEWNFTLSTIKGEVPALTAIQTKGYPEVAIVLYLQGCIRGKLCKTAVLIMKAKDTVIK